MGYLTSFRTIFNVGYVYTLTDLYNDYSAPTTYAFEKFDDFLLMYIYICTYTYADSILQLSYIIVTSYIADQTAAYFCVQWNIYSTENFKMPSFHVVQFLNELNVCGQRVLDLVPSSWIVVENEKYYTSYPPEKDHARVSSWTAVSKDPNPAWIKYPVKIIATAGNYI